MQAPEKNTTKKRYDSSDKADVEPGCASVDVLRLGVGRVHVAPLQPPGEAHVPSIRERHTPRKPSNMMILEQLELNYFLINFISLVS